MEDMKYFLKQSEEYDNLTDFLDDIITMRKEDKRNDNNDCLTIITMHKAKGLEWDNVFIPFVDKGEYPRCKDKEFLQNTENIKNERNLFYVAITRARKMLYISYSLYYTDKPAGPSPFLEEIDEDLYEADFFKEENKVE
jgi:superfamily I DNA/RNA helicase